MKDTKSTSDTFLSYAISNISSPERVSIVVWKFDITENKKSRHSSFILFYCYVCAKPSEWITSVGTSHVGYSHGGREKRKKIISYTAQWINNNSSSPAGRVSKKGRDIKNMKRQCASSVHITSIIIVLQLLCKSRRE